MAVLISNNPSDVLVTTLVCDGCFGSGAEPHGDWLTEVDCDQAKSYFGLTEGQAVYCEVCGRQIRGEEQTGEDYGT